MITPLALAILLHRIPQDGMSPFPGWALTVDLRSQDGPLTAVGQKGIGVGKSGDTIFVTRQVGSVTTAVPEDENVILGVAQEHKWDFEKTNLFRGKSLGYKRFKGLIRSVVFNEFNLSNAYAITYESDSGKSFRDWLKALSDRFGRPTFAKRLEIETDSGMITRALLVQWHWQFPADHEYADAAPVYVALQYTPKMRIDSPSQVSTCPELSTLILSLDPDWVTQVGGIVNYVQTNKPKK